MLVASLLPDIIDKPVGQLLFKATFNYGRIFAHTLLFSIMLALGGYYLYRRRGRLWLLVLAFGSLAHIMEDQMWLEPKTWLWPLYGWAFPQADLTGWITNMLYKLLTTPAEYIPELVGLAILSWFALALVRRRQVTAFIKSGQLR